MNLARSFLYDVPMILSTPIKNGLGITDADIQFLYSAFYLPPIFTNLPYGALQKRIGPKCCYIALATMIFGQALFWCGLGFENYWLLFLGRICIGAGGEGTLISQVYTVKWYHYDPNITTMISSCKFCARIALILCYYGLPTLYLSTGHFWAPMMFTTTIVLCSSAALKVYLGFAEKDAKKRADFNTEMLKSETTAKHVSKADAHKTTAKLTCADFKRFDAKYYCLLFIRFAIMGSWFGFSAMFMQYLEAGCGMKYNDAALLIIVNPFIAMCVVFFNIFINRRCNTLNYALFGCALMVSIFLWTSAFVVDKGMGMAYFAIIAISISGGYFNVCIDSFLAKFIDPDMAAVGTGISMSVKGISCLIFPMINGLLMGTNATQESIASCCMFMAVPSTLGFLLICYFMRLQPSKPKAGEKKDETPKLEMPQNLEEKLVPKTETQEENLNDKTAN